MTSPNDPDPVTLAKIAAQLDPKLACDNPAKAIELARKLLIAADPELAKQEADRDEDMQFEKEAQRHHELFPPSELISLAEAFNTSPGDYKTESGFAAALRKAKLTFMAQEVDWAQWREAKSPAQTEKSVTYSEVTSLRAVKELFRLQHEETLEEDRKRKTPSNKKSQKNVVEFQEQKAEQNHRKAERKSKKAEAIKQKAEVPKST